MPFDPKDPEAIAAIKAAVEDATSGLVTKRDELLNEVKKLRKSAEITPDRLEAVEAERDKLATELSAAQKELKDAKKTSDAATKQLTDEQGFTTKLLVENGLMEALAKVNVTNPVHLKAATAMLRAQVEIKDRKAVVGDKELASFVKEWSSGDEGKHFVTAPGNSGGGAPGSGVGSGGADLMKLPPTQRMEAARAAKAAAGKT